MMWPFKRRKIEYVAMTVEEAYGRQTTSSSANYCATQPGDDKPPPERDPDPYEGKAAREHVAMILRAAAVSARQEKPERWYSLEQIETIAEERK